MGSKSVAFKVTLSLLLAGLLFPVAGNAQEKASGTVQEATPPNDEELLGKAFALIQKAAFKEARPILQGIVDRQKQKPALPYVKDDTLHIYTHNQSEIIAFGAIGRLPEEKQKELKEKVWPWAIELEKAHPWKNISFENPILPTAYFALAHICTEEGDLKKAMEYLKSSVAAWPDYTPAHAEMVYLLIRERNFDEAKKVAQEAIDKHSYFSPEGRSRLFRHLGYIAIEEGQPDEAEGLFNESLKLEPDNPSAKQELEYIKQQRDKKQQ
ncbi:MAG TPA: tetratricopeptide repeat protein [bacterium]|nr:tetratricopeptide repeat protein [bacterium]HQL62503.1 tetratricopeptide repeat protein [bacterium]